MTRRRVEGGKADVGGWDQGTGLEALLKGFDFVLQAVGSQRMIYQGCNMTRSVILEIASGK